MNKEHLKNKVVVIVGPTASGKSDLAVFLAKKFDGEVLSADSRQIYKGLNIGSGKITKKEMGGIPHHLLDIASVKRTYSVQQYKKAGQKVLNKLFKKNKLPIIAGGSGFYVDALIYDQKFPAVVPNKVLRKKLEKESTEKLFAILKKKDPARAKNIDAKNRHRLIRALEIVEGLGSVPVSQKPKLKYDTLVLEIDIDDEKLRENIKKRINKRLKVGMIDEVKSLRKSGVSWKRLEGLGLEYKYIAEFLQEKISSKNLPVILENKIWQFSRRQKTWNKKYTGKQKIKGKKEAEKLVKNFLKN